MARAAYNDLHAYVICTAESGNLATLGVTCTSLEGDSPPRVGTINTIVAFNYAFTHEAMLEPMADGPPLTVLWVSCSPLAFPCWALARCPRSI